MRIICACPTLLAPNEAWIAYVAESLFWLSRSSTGCLPDLAADLVDDFINF